MSGDSARNIPNSGWPCARIRQRRRIIPAPSALQRRDEGVLPADDYGPSRVGAFSSGFADVGALIVHVVVAWPQRGLRARGREGPATNVDSRGAGARFGVDAVVEDEER